MAKFVWNVEEVKYVNMDEKSREYVVDDYTLEEQEEALHEYANFDFDKFWALYRKFQSEKDTIKAKGTHYDGSPCYNTNSLKAWLKRNGITSYYKTPQECMMFDIYYSSSWSRYYTLSLTMSIKDINEAITRSFTHMISVLASKEKSWFREHDEYSILESEIEHTLGNSIHLPVPCHISYGTGGVHLVNNDKERKFTLDELKLLSDYYHRIDEAIKAVEKPNIVF